MFDTSTALGKRAVERLRDEKIIWLTTVDASGAPKPAPVWFLFDGRRIVVYSLDVARRLANIRANPRVALNLNCSPGGGDVIVLHGTARIAEELPAAADSPEYLARYGVWIDEEKSWDGPRGFSEQYSVPVAIEDLSLWGF